MLESSSTVLWPSRELQTQPVVHLTQLRTFPTNQSDFWQVFGRTLLFRFLTLLRTSTRLCTLLSRGRLLFARLCTSLSLGRLRFFRFLRILCTHTLFCTLISLPLHAFEHSEYTPHMQFSIPHTHSNRSIYQRPPPVMCAMTRRQ